MLFEMVYEQKQGMWCSTSPVSPIHSIKPHRSTLCTYGAYQLKEQLFFHFVYFHVDLLSLENEYEKRASTYKSETPTATSGQT